MADDWYYAHDGQQHGPVGDDELKRLTAAGGLQPGDLVWKEGMPEWAAVGTVPGLVPPAAPALPRVPALPVAQGKVALRLVYDGLNGIVKGMAMYMGIFGFKVQFKVYVDGRLIGESPEKEAFDYRIDLAPGTHLIEVVKWEGGEKGRMKFPLNLDKVGVYKVRLNNANNFEASTVDFLQQP